MYKRQIKDGKIDFANLYLGNYYVKEISPGEGYLLDETAYPVEVAYEGQEVEIVHRYVTVKETVIKQAFELIKISEDGEQTETDLVEGAGFKIFRISQLSGVKDGTLTPVSYTHLTVCVRASSVFPIVNVSGAFCSTTLYFPKYSSSESALPSFPVFNSCTNSPAL